MNELLLKGLVSYHPTMHNKSVQLKYTSVLSSLVVIFISYIN